MLIFHSKITLSINQAKLGGSFDPLPQPFAVDQLFINCIPRFDVQGCIRNKIFGKHNLHHGSLSESLAFWK